jgi:hypothetical protein
MSSDPRLDAIEHRLVRQASVVATAEHRDRVLAAVQDVLTSGPLSMTTVENGLGMRGTAALVAMALTAAIMVVGPWLVIPQAVAPLPTEPSLVVQAREAGIDLPTKALAATDTAAGAPRHIPSLPRQSDEAFRWRHRLQGEL